MNALTKIFSGCSIKNGAGITAYTASLIILTFKSLGQTKKANEATVKSYLEVNGYE